jgi:DNA-binding NtrC family response regulator
VLLVEDTVSLARTYMEYLKGGTYEVSHVETGKEAYAALEREAPAAVLLDLVLPDADGLDILKNISERGLNTAVVVITAHGSINTAVEAMRLGAFDFLVKPFTPERLKVTLDNALEHRRLTDIVETYRSNFDRHEYFGFIGSSLAMQGVYRIIDSAAPSKATVFITGESGTGKEICAEAVHRQSPRADKPFIAINCGAIPKDLMESEIFGHKKGAFTGAVSDRDGAAAQADGGTLFLDEICEMDLQLQTKLLRFLQTGTFQKVGGSQMEQVDIRIVCATNRDPFEEVAAGRFREDLFYRLHVLPIHLPPLSQRDADVIEIAEFFLDEFSREERKHFQRFAPETEAVLQGYSWPGNVRQLQNVVRNMIVLNDGEEITPDMLPAPLDKLVGAVPATPNRRASDRNPKSAFAVDVGNDGGRTPDEMIRPLAEVERDVIERAIDLCGGNVPKAAALLGISASTIYRKKAVWEKVSA